MLGLTTIEDLLLLNLTVMVAVSIFGFAIALKEIRKIHVMLNSRLSELISVSAKAAHAAGIEEERGRPSQRY